ncbi:MAG: hypothetical protein LBT09_00100 [Planctomycetaceae bacterium]|nr:hypothetical protein [Planctomycetaceae bacterium]
MFRPLVMATAFVCAFSLSVSFAQESTATTNEKPAENRLEVETADLAQPAGKGITPKKEHKGTVPRKAGKVTKEQRETIRNLDKEYARLIEILQIRLDLLKKERASKINELIDSIIKERQTTAEKK